MLSIDISICAVIVAALLMQYSHADDQAYDMYNCIWSRISDYVPSKSEFVLLSTVLYFHTIRSFLKLLLQEIHVLYFFLTAGLHHRKSYRKADYPDKTILHWAWILIAWMSWSQTSVLPGLTTEKWARVLSRFLQPVHLMNRMQ